MMMHKKIHRSGFSLVEVLFAMLILTLGMLMVSMQFPIGILNAQKAVEATQAQVSQQNALVQLELEINTILFNNSTLADSMMLTGDKVGVHPMMKPNVYADYANDQPFPTLVIDDPEYYAFRLVSYTLKIPYLPFWFYYHQVQDQDDFTTAFTGIEEITTDYYNSIPTPVDRPFGDIGNMFCPPVGPTTPAVLDLLMNEWGYIDVNDLNYNKYMEEAIYEVAMKSEYSWSAFYSPDNFVYIFILKHNQTGLRYAIQDPASAYIDIVSPLWVNDVNVVDLPYPNLLGNWNDLQPTMYVGLTKGTWPVGMYNGGANYNDGPTRYGNGNAALATDRLLPVPWRVYLDDVAVLESAPGEDFGTLFVKHIDDEDGLPSGFLNDLLEDKDDEVETMQTPWSFSVRPRVAELLRPGSYILDGDPANGFPAPVNNLTTGLSGELYQVDTIEPDERFTDRFIVTLKTPLRDDLFSFWVYPPNVIRDGDGDYFAEEQPVVRVAKIKMKLK